MDPDLDRSALERRISKRFLDEGNLTSLPDIGLDSASGSGSEDGDEVPTQREEERVTARKREAIPATPQQTSRVLREMHIQDRPQQTPSIEATPIARTYKAVLPQATPAPAGFKRSAAAAAVRATPGNLTAIPIPDSSAGADLTADADRSTSTSSSSSGALGAHYPPRLSSESFELHAGMHDTSRVLATPAGTELGGHDFAASSSRGRGIVSSTPAVWAGVGAAAGQSLSRRSTGTEPSGMTVRPTPAPTGGASHAVPLSTGRTPWGRIMQPSKGRQGLMELGLMARKERADGRNQPAVEEEQHDNRSGETDPHALGDVYAPDEDHTGESHPPHFSGMTIVSPSMSLREPSGLDHSGEEDRVSRDGPGGQAELEAAAEAEASGEQDRELSYEEEIDSFDVPVKANSPGTASAVASPAPNWVDDRRRHRARTKTPSPDTPGREHDHAPGGNASMGSLGSLRLPDETEESGQYAQEQGSGEQASFEERRDEDEHRMDRRQHEQNRIPSLATDHGSVSDDSAHTTPERRSPDHSQDHPGDFSDAPVTRIVHRTPSIYATPSSVKPSLDVVDEGDETEFDEQEGEWAPPGDYTRGAATPARYPAELSRGPGGKSHVSLAGLGGSFASSPGMARGQTTVESFHTPGSGFQPDLHGRSALSPSVADNHDLSLGESAAEMHQQLLSGGQASVTETPKARSIGAGAGSALLQSARKSFVHNVLDSSVKSGRASRRSARYSSGSSRTDEGSVLGGTSHRSMRLAVATPHSKADYDGSSDISYVSVASSSDLTTDRRTTSTRFKGNVSVPSIMPSGSGHVDGHANAVKIAKHLSGINHVLEDENKELKARVDHLEGCLVDFGVLQEGTDGAEVDAARLDEVLALLAKQQGASGIQDDIDSTSAQQMIERLTARIQALEADLQEKDAATREREPEATVADRQQLEEAQRVREEQAAEIDSLRERLSLTEQTFQERLQKHARDFEEIVNEKDADAASMEKALKSQMDRLRMENDALTREKDRLRSVLDSDSHEEKESKLQAQVEALQQEVRSKEARSQRQVVEADDLRQRLQAAEDRLREEAERTANVQRQADSGALQLAAVVKARDEVQLLYQQSMARVQSLENDVEQQHQRGLDEEAKTKQIIESLEHDAETSRIRTQQLQEACASKQRRVEDLERDGAESDEVIHKLEGELKAVRSALEQQQAEALSTRSELEDARAALSSRTMRRSPSPLNTQLEKAQADAAALRADLAAATETIDRLQTRRSSPSPRLQVEVQAKDRRIEQLDQEKAELSERLRALRVQLDAAQISQRTPKPSNQSVMAAASPFSSTMPINKRLLNLQTPRTPGVMKEMSWLNTSMGGDYEASAIAQMQALQAELDEANKKLDANFHRLETAGLRQVSLSDQYVQLCDQKQGFEQEVADLRARSLQARERLRHLRCPGCKDSFDASDALLHGGGAESSMFGNDTTPKARLLNSNVLQNTANTLRRQYEDLRAQWQADCERSNAKIQSLQAALQSITEAKETSEEELQHLLEISQETLRNREAELKREKTRAERATQDQQNLWKQEKLRLGEEKARLRREMQDLEGDLAVAKRAAAGSREADSVAQQLRERSAALDAATKECDDLRRHIHDKTQELDRAERRWSARSREYDQMKKDLDHLESQLARQRREAESFKRDLAAVQDARQMRKSSDAELDRLRQTADEADRMILSLQGVIARLEADLAAGAIPASSSGSPDMPSAYLSERKQLTAQIRYLQAKFSRENMFRSSLQVQKQYLLCLVGKFKQTEQETLALIASMGFPAERHTSQAKYSFKAVATAVLATVRARRAAVEWRQTMNVRTRIVKEHSKARQDGHRSP